MPTIPMGIIWGPLTHGVDRVNFKRRDENQFDTRKQFDMQN